VAHSAKGGVTNPAFRRERHSPEWRFRLPTNRELGRSRDSNPRQAFEERILKFSNVCRYQLPF